MHDVTLLTVAGTNSAYREIGWQHHNQAPNSKKEEQFGACKHHMQILGKANHPNHQVCHTRYKKHHVQAQVI